MKKLATLCLTLALGFSLTFAASPVKRQIGPDARKSLSTKVVTNPYASTLKQAKQQAEVAVPMYEGTYTFLPKMKGKAAPAKAGASGSTIYGDLVYDSNEVLPLGPCEVFLDGSITNLASFDGMGMGYDISIAVEYVREGHLLGIAQETLWGMFILGEYSFDIDLSTGELNYEDMDAPYYYTYAYYPEEDRVYAYMDDSAGGIVFGYFDAADPANPFVQVSPGVVDFSVFGGGVPLIATTINQIDGRMITVANTNYGGGIFEVDKTSGALTQVATCENSSDYITGICYSPFDGGYVFAVCTLGSCALQILDDTTFSVLESVPYSGDIEFMSLHCADTQKIEANAPGESTLINAIFANGATSGTLTYKLADVTHAGNPIIGNIDWMLEIDGVEYQRGSAKAGSNVTISVKDLQQGLHKFTFKASLGGRFGRYLYTTLYIGNDTPKAPAAVEINSSTVSWTPVTEGVHAGYVNAAEVVYNVYVNNKLIASEIKATQCPAQLDPDASLDFYVASVEAVFSGLVSERTNSNDFIYGQALPLPQAFTPTEKESRLFTIVDNNGANSIEYYITEFSFGSFSGYRYQYNSRTAADDYLFLPIMKFDDANAVYEFNGELFATTATYPERFELVLATAPEVDAVVKNLCEPRYAKVATTSFEEGLESICFTVPEAGDYLVGIHVISDADQFRLWMKEFSVKKVPGVTADAPGAATDLYAEAGANGDLHATVYFTLPTTEVNGNTIPVAKDLTASVKADGCDAVSVTGKPGEEKSVVIPTAQGVNNVAVTVYDGDLKGIDATLEVYTGVEPPYIPTNVVATPLDDDLTVRITWSAPAVGMYGGYVEPTGITYYECYQDYYGDWYIGDPIGTDVYSYDYVLPEGTSQALMRWGILAENFAGMATTLAVSSFVAGEPLVTPYTNTYAAGDNTQPIVNYTNGVSWRLGDPSAGWIDDFENPEAKTILYSASGSVITNAKMTMPKFSAKDLVNPTIILTVEGGICGEFQVYASAYGVEETAVSPVYAKTDLEPGEQKIVCELPAEFIGKGWVMPSIHFSTSGWTESMMIHSWSYVDYLADDFGILQLAGANHAKVGEESTFTAEVKNYGFNANTRPAGTWTLTREDGTVLAEATVAATSDVIEPDGTFATNISYTPTADDLGGLTLSFAINASDDKAANDSKTINVTVAAGPQPVVTDLHAEEISYDKVALGWSAPAVGAGGEESFEDETPFLNDTYGEEIGMFRRYDGDGGQVYGINVDGYAAQEWAYQPMSFMVWSEAGMDEIMAGYTNTYTAHTGDKYIVAIVPTTGVPADDWLISPEVRGGSSISFYARPFTFQYGAEVIEIMYSTSGDNMESFQVLETLTISGAADATPVWEQYEFALPADAKYFALHYVSNDIFGICIDDIVFTPAGSEAEVDKYLVYRDGTLLGEVATTAFEDGTVADNTEYSYIVVPVLTDETRGLDSNTLVIRTTGVESVKDAAHAIYVENGVLVVKGFEGQRVVVATADGKLVGTKKAAAAVENYNVEPGVYAVMAGKTVVKVIVK